MSYTPMTADEAAKLSLRDEGTYAFEVLNATAAVSKEKKNEMIALELSFFDQDGARFSIKDWLVHSDSRWAEKKFFDFANTTGITAQYLAGKMTAEDCLGRSGLAVVGIQKGKKKDNSEEYFPDRNKVKYYTGKAADKKAGEPAAGAPKVAKPSENLEEDVPFN